MARTLLASAGRRYPLYQGCGRLANLPAAVTLCSLPEPEQRVTLRDGTVLRVRVDDFLGRALYYFGDFDRRLTWLMARVLRPGDTFVDIGANYGWLSLTAARLVGPAGRVHAFEPQTGVAAMLRRSVEDAGADHVRVHEVALSDASGTLDLWVPLGKLGSASLGRRGDHDMRVPVTAEVAGPYLGGLGLEHVRMLKIDVEGHEDAVIRGARPWLEQAMVDAIVFEWNDPRPLAASDTATILGDLGYRLFQVETGPFRPRITSLASGPRPANDFLALPARSAGIERRVVVHGRWRCGAGPVSRRAGLRSSRT